jgi:hypothetical protein
MLAHKISIHSVRNTFLKEIPSKLARELYDFQRDTRVVLRRRSRRTRTREAEDAARERAKERERGRGERSQRDEKDEEEQKNLRPCRAAD